MKNIMLSRVGFFALLAANPWLRECLTLVTDFTVYCTVTDEQAAQLNKE